MKRVLPAIILLLITAAAVAFIYRDRIFPRPQTELAGERPSRGGGFGRRGRWGGGNSNRPVSILAEDVRTANVPVYLDGVGTVQAYNSVTVRPQVSGRLIEVNFTEGQSVKKGDVLAKIDPASYQAAYDQFAAKKGIDVAALENAQGDLKRFETLAKSSYGSQQQLEAQQSKVAQLQAQIRQDEAAINSVKTDLDRTTIRAPIDGRTGIRDVDVGNLVTASDSSGIVVITQIQPISVFFTLPETYVGELVAAQKAGTVELTATITGKTVGKGSLQVIDNRINQNTGTVRLKGVFANEDLSLWPGQFVNIRLHLKTLNDATVISSAAIQQGAAGRFVYVVQPEGTVKLTPVGVTQEGESVAVIASGIAPGERVASSGFANLQDGSKVTIDDGRPGEAAPEGEKRPHQGKRGKDWKHKGQPPAPGAELQESQKGGVQEQALGQTRAAGRRTGQD